MNPYMQDMIKQANLAASSSHPCALFRTHMPTMITQHMAGIFPRPVPMDHGLGSYVRYIMNKVVH